MDKSNKFNIGDKVYCIKRGIGEVTALLLYGYLQVEVTFNKALGANFSACGRQDIYDKNPILLTLEEAKAKGYDIPKEKVMLKRRVKWYALTGGTVYPACLPGTAQLWQDLIGKTGTLTFEED